jgi:dihydrofolate synthase/folylpolyglutamate synthase
LASEIEQNTARHEAALRFLDLRINYERDRSVPYRPEELKLSRMQELLARLNNPQQGLPIVHVAGTKGKGSTAAMLGAMLSAAGYRSGVFTSPHLYRIEERMAVDGRPCSSAELVELVDRLRPAVEAMDQAALGGGVPACGSAEHGPTYFEITTALALLHFARLNVQTAVLEVGLGGRLDSTNVCRPRVSVITSISFDHTRQLGNTLESIAWEKAGIVKPSVPVVSGVVDPRPRDVIREVCRQRGCRLSEMGVAFDFTYHPPSGLERAAALGSLDFRYHAPGRPSFGRCPTGYRDLPLRLLGGHQAANAAVALAAVAELERAGWNVPEAAVRRGLAEVVWPARVEVLARRPVVVVDAAHNVASIEALLRVLQESFSVGRRLLVFATTHEKDVRGMLDRLLRRFDEVIVTRYLNNPRAVSAEELQSVALDLTGRRYHVCPGPAEAWSEVCSLATPDDLICVTGSFFLAAEMREQILIHPWSLVAGVPCGSRAPA